MWMYFSAAVTVALLLPFGVCVCDMVCVIVVESLTVFKSLHTVFEMPVLRSSTLMY